MTVIIFILVLAVLIFVHELGHFLVARAFKIRVDAFKIGFGPRILSWKRGETEYGLNLIPFGGYVKIFGENPDVESMSGPDASRSFVNKPRWQQALVLFAGVFFNFLFAWILYVIIFSSGVTASTDGLEKYADRFQDERIMITYVGQGSPAEKAGIRSGDVIKRLNLVDGESISIDNQINIESQIQTIQKTIDQSNGNPISFEYLRDDTISNVQIIPITGIVPDKYAIGIAMQSVADIRLPFLNSIYEGGHYTLVLIRDTAIGLYTFIANIFQGEADFSDVAGPIGIAGIVGSAAKIGFNYLLIITAIISINLGVINLIPFPALDGGRILFVGIEGIIRRRIPAKFFNIVNTVGFVLLMILMVIVTYKDIAKLFI
ncbi:MAG: site-2 protease family protein [Candidatus Paceibacterota bacterium]|jgi:regulator of sigma E protease